MIDEEFGEIRTLNIDGEPWFVGRDIAEVLGYTKARNAIATYVDSDDKKDAPIQGTLGGAQNMTIINESSLYSLILDNKKSAFGKLICSLHTYYNIVSAWYAVNCRIP